VLLSLRLAHDTRFPFAPRACLRTGHTPNRGRGGGTDGARGARNHLLPSPRALRRGRLRNDRYSGKAAEMTMFSCCL
jgi:hypothetical protein